MPNSTPEIPIPRQPYKFLDFYTENDRDIFFGRRHETELLLADIIAARLVVLFAKTGSGKSSLINAAIRPRLHDLNYDTAFVRVGLTREPSAAARDALGLPPDGRNFAEQLFAFVEQRRRPLVLFFDQFEEFFLFILRGGPVEKEAATEFVKSAGMIHRKRDSGVHVVFSLREDFLAEMDAFSDEIPTIFHADSRLRLRPFTDEQAREVIEGPARTIAEPFIFESGVVDRIVSDLPREGGGIGPAPLQIVCDTLWRSMNAGTIGHELYERLGGAIVILEKRLIADIQTLDGDDLDVFIRLIPYLRTDDGTKQIRSVSELTSLLTIDGPGLTALVGKLVVMRLLRETPRDGDLYVEWMSDYLAALSRSLETTLQVSLLARSRVDRERLRIVLTDQEILRRLSTADWERLLDHTLAIRDMIGFWHANGLAYGHDVWNSIRNRLSSPNVATEDKETLIEFLGELGTREAVAILATVVNMPPLAVDAVRVLGTIEIEEARAVLAQIRSRSELRDAAVEAEKASAALRAPTIRGFEEEPIAQYAPEPRFSALDWDLILHAIRSERCLPVLGPGAIAGHLPTPRQIAREWAKRFDYPFADAASLMDVAEYLSVTQGPWYPKRLMSQIARETARDTTAPSARVLASLPFRAYVTCNYDPSQQNALREAGRTPVVDVAQWWRVRERQHPKPRYRDGSQTEPLVFHCYGHIDQPESMVITLQDHLDWLIAVSSERNIISPVIGDLFANATLLLLGLSPMDLSFQVLISFLRRYMHRSEGFGNLITLLPSLDASGNPAPLDYMGRYFDIHRTKIWWGSTTDFIEELGRRWAASLP